MKLNDEKIRALLHAYRENPSAWPSVEPALRSELELYVYRFPRLAYRQNADVCSDFYLWVLDRLEACVAHFPLDRPIRFKTWWNAVLRNQYTHYLRAKRRGERAEVPIEWMEEDLPVEAFAPEDASFENLRAGVSALPDADRLLLLFHYMPESVGAKEIMLACTVFGLPPSELLAIRSELVRLHAERADRTRALSENLSTETRAIGELRAAVYRLRLAGGEEAEARRHVLFAKIARREGRKAKIARELTRPDRESCAQVCRLLHGAANTRNRLEIATRRLRYEVLSRGARNAATA
jgi:hypothetical protein